MTRSPHAPAPARTPARPLPGLLALFLTLFLQPAALPFVLSPVHPRWVGARDGKIAPTALATPPNIVLIVADDLGYGDLGCYGQEQLATPHLDRLAAEGRRFTQFYAGSTVCAPSRSVLMTGLHTGHTPIRGNSKQNLDADDVTLAEVLQAAGYRTALFGKWGLGHEGSAGVPTRQGFDEFFGYLDQHHAHNYYPTFLIHKENRVRLNNTVPDAGRWGQGVATERNEYSHDRIATEALAWLRQRKQDQPFFLCLTWTLPHANNEAGRAGMEVPELGRFAEQDWPAPERGFAAMVERLDSDVGRVRAALAELDLAGNTLVLFTSDNGPHSEGGHRAAFFRSSGKLQGIKRSLHEGGVRVPLIAAWPRRVPPGTTSDRIAGFWDVMPTLAGLAGPAAVAALPTQLDGRSFAQSLRGRPEPEPPSDAYFGFYEGGGGRSLRVDRWKLIEQPIGSPLRLYDLSNDPGESRDLAAALPERVRELSERMRAHDAPSPVWKFPQ